MTHPRKESGTLMTSFRKALCVAVACAIVLLLRGDVWAASTSSTYYGGVVTAPKDYAYAPTVVNDNGKYKMWFGANHPNPPSGEYRGDQIYYCESDNGISWGTPVRVLGPTLGNSMDRIHVCDPSVVIKTEDAPRNSASASSALPGWPASAAIDGNAASCWSSNYHASTNGTEWLELNLGSTIGVNAITLTPRPSGYCFPVDFKLQYYDGSWHDIPGQSYTNYSNPGPTPQVFNFPTLKASKVRLYATKLGTDNNGNHYCQMGEIAATKATFYMYYTGTEDYHGRYNQIFLATSSDGVNWTKHGVNSPVIPISGYKYQHLADFESGVDNRWSFHSANYSGTTPTAQYASTTPPDNDEHTADFNYWDVYDDGNGSNGYVDGHFALSGEDREWGNYSNLAIHWYAWTTRGQNGKVRVYAHNGDSGGYYDLGEYTLEENKSIVTVIDISSITSNNIDRVQFRVQESYFSDLQTSTNRQRTHIHYINMMATPANYSIGQSSVHIKDGYFYQFFTDLNGQGAGGGSPTYLARSGDGVNWTRLNNGNYVFSKSCVCVKYIASHNKYYMIYGNVDAYIWWNISSSMTSWPAHDHNRRINVSSHAHNHNPGLLGDGNGHMSTTTKGYYGAGPAWGDWDLHMSDITVTP